MKKLAKFNFVLIFRERYQVLFRTCVFLGTRLRTTFDFGLVTLDISGIRDDDSGIYTCKATNLAGEAVSTATIKVEGIHLNISLLPTKIYLVLEKNSFIALN